MRAMRKMSQPDSPLRIQQCMLDFERVLFVAASCF
jgi:hypothetical protein